MSKKSNTSLKEIFRLFIAYVLVHFFAVLFANMTTVMLYVIEYGIHDAMFKPIWSVTKVNWWLMAWLSVTIIYPLVWMTVYGALSKFVKHRRMLVLSFGSFAIGLIPVAVFVDFDSFFDFRFGAFKFLLGFVLAPVLYENLKRFIPLPVSNEAKS
jgi:hypothetical protein